MNRHIDEIIEHFVQLTHSPRGQYAAGDETYRQLLSRLTEAPVTENVTPHTTGARRWSAAASVALIVGFGIAIAGVYVFRHGFMSDNELPLQQTPASETTSVQTLVFENKTLAEIASILTDAYSVNICIGDAELAEYRVTATFRTDEPLVEVLDILAEVADFTYEATDEGYFLK